MSVSGMKVLVTGASSGIGAHIAQFLVGAGAQVVVAARRIQALEQFVDEAGDSAHAVQMDVTNPDQVIAGTQEAARLMGGLDGLFANAGISWGGPATNMSEQDWTNLIDVNLNGVFRTCRAAAPIMAQGGGGAIVSTSSMAAFRPGAAIAAYATSKAGVVHLTRSLALEWAPMNIRVNAIAPGYFPTEMTSPFLDSDKGPKLASAIPMGRFGNLPELEGPIELLLGSRGSFITGVTLPVDGGHFCQSI
ncbi:MAG: SDR family oxidoreductase [Pseudomonadota bacterium]